jgi:DNA invertase Pin-like site-specific DNA recombinase
VEDASRFARELMAQELGVMLMIKRGVKVVTADDVELTDTSDPMKKMMRQIAGSFAEFEKARLVAKLKGARERKMAERKQVTLDGRGKCGGRQSLREKRPEVVEAARAVNDGRSLDKIAAVLAEQGHVTPSGKTYGAAAIQSMLGSEFKSRALERRKVAERKKKLQPVEKEEDI